MDLDKINDCRNSCGNGLRDFFWAYVSVSVISALLFAVYSELPADMQAAIVKSFQGAPSALDRGFAIVLRFMLEFMVSMTAFLMCLLIFVAVAKDFTRSIHSRSRALWTVSVCLVVLLFGTIAYLIVDSEPVSTAISWAVYFVTGV